MAYVPVVNWTITPPFEADLSEEHEQNTIAWALANAHGKEGSVATMQQLPSQPAKWINTTHKDQISANKGNREELCGDCETILFQI